MKKKSTESEVQLTAKELSKIDFQEMILEQTPHRYDRVNGYIVPVLRWLGDGGYESNPAYEYAEFGQINLAPKEKGKFRVMKISIIYARIMKGRKLREK